MTGENIMYIYPDLATCLVGRFTDGVMEEAREARVEGVKWVEDILVVEVGECKGPVFSYSPSNNKTLGVTWLQEDPFERDRVECSTSDISGAGTGLFARRTLPPGTYACFYHGLHFGACEKPSQTSYDYMIFLDWDKAPLSDYLDLMPETWCHTRYCATLGHKVNHSFSPNCQYTKFEHPRLGKSVLGIRTLVEVQQGEELTCNYRYDVNDAPVWFSQIFAGEDSDDKDNK